MRKYYLQMGLLWSKTLCKILLNVEPFFTVLAITSSFQIRFRFVWYRLECLDVFLLMTRNCLSIINRAQSRSQSNLVECAYDHDSEGFATFR
jgi:hypothetical protein